jgi:hypothetical protein
VPNRAISGANILTIPARFVRSALHDSLAENWQSHYNRCWPDQLGKPCYTAARPSDTDLVYSIVRRARTNHSRAMLVEPEKVPNLLQTKEIFLENGR